MIEIEKTISINYKDIETLLEREESMLQTLQNYLSREDNYEFIESTIVAKEDKFTLNLKIRLKNEHNS